MHCQKRKTGKCECGEVDPNYVPPHVCTFVEGKCECGETDPSYVNPNGLLTSVAPAAVWEPKVIINLCVYLGTMDGAEDGTFNDEDVMILTLEVAPGNTLDLTQYVPTAPSSSYTFRGWYMDPNASDEEKKFEQFEVTSDHLAANEEGGLYFFSGWTYKPVVDDIIDTKDDLMAAIQDGDSEIVLAGNIALSNPIGFGEGEDTTLDLNGHTLSMETDENGAAMIVVTGNLTIKDSAGGGKIVFTAKDSGGRKAILNMGVLTIDGGTIESSYNVPAIKNGNMWYECPASYR